MASTSRKPAPACGAVRSSPHAVIGQSRISINHDIGGYLLRRAALEITYYLLPGLYFIDITGVMPDGCLHLAYRDKLHIRAGVDEMPYVVKPTDATRQRGTPSLARTIFIQPTLLHRHLYTAHNSIYK